MPQEYKMPNTHQNPFMEKSVVFFKDNTENRKLFLNSPCPIPIEPLMGILKITKAGGTEAIPAETPLCILSVIQVTQTHIRQRGK